jgi:TolA-binding protein
MLKQILPLLFILIFSINLFAESHDIHREISDIKLQIQEIKLLDARDEKEKKIEILEKDLKELEEKFNQNNIDKKELDGKLEKTKDIIERQDSRIGDLDFTLNFYGILITILFAIGSVATYKISSNNALEEAQKELEHWVKTKADSEFKSLVDDAKNEIQINANEVLQEIKDESTNKIDSFIKSLENKSIKDKEGSYLDLFNLVISDYNKGNIKEALENIEKASNCAKSKKEIIQSLFVKGLLLEESEKLEEAIVVYDKLTNRFKDSRENFILEEIATSFHNKGVLLGQLGKSEKAIEVYDELIKRFKDSKKSVILKQVSSALLNKIEMNLILDNTNSKEDLDLYFNLIKENKEQLLKFEMLQVFEKAKSSNQDEEIKEWKIKFKDTKLGNWSFNELKTWAGTLEDEVKERVLRYIDIFENHNKNIEEK